MRPQRAARNGPGLRDERARLTAPWANLLADDDRVPALTIQRTALRAEH